MIIPASWAMVVKVNSEVKKIIFKRGSENKIKNEIKMKTESQYYKYKKD